MSKEKCKIRPTEFIQSFLGDLKPIPIVYMRLYKNGHKEPLLSELDRVAITADLHYCHIQQIIDGFKAFQVAVAEPKWNFLQTKEDADVGGPLDAPEMAKLVVCECQRRAGQLLEYARDIRAQAISVAQQRFAKNGGIKFIPATEEEEAAAKEELRKDVKELEADPVYKDFLRALKQENPTLHRDFLSRTKDILTNADTFMSQTVPQYYAKKEAPSE